MASARLQAAEAQLNDARRAHQMALDAQRGEAATNQNQTAVIAALKEKKEGTMPAGKKRISEASFISRLKWGTQQALPPGALHGEASSTFPTNLVREQGSSMGSHEQV